MNTLIDGLGIDQLMQRYGLNSKTQLQTRRDKLGLKFEAPNGGRKTIATHDQILLLDQLHDFIKNGGSIDKFIETKRLNQSTELSSELSSESNSGQSDLLQLSHGLALLADAIASSPGNLFAASYPQIVHRLSTPSDPLMIQEQLQRVSDRGWIISTSQLSQILGVKKFGSDRYGFVFLKAGTIGRETGWMVRRKE